MPQKHPSSRRPNLLSAVVLALAVALLYGSFEPVPAGASPEIAHEEQPAPLFEVPMPMDAAAMPIPEDGVESQDVDDSGDSASAASVAAVSSDQDNIKFCMLVLKDGFEHLRNVETYSAVFHKTERIDGDLSDLQSIELKVRQAPKFAVHMRWRNGDRGRQLLYSEDYEDGEMVVKLGGFKGRLLPAIKLDPNGSRARSEARYPVTNAGILGMVEKLIAHREQDLKCGHGVRCQRLPNQEFDERDCYCFLFEYESPEVGRDYRKSILLVDSRHHIPVMARNFVWAAEGDDLTPEELDAITLVEDYSFTEIDFGKELTAVEFSRDNPRYRM